ncbi:hypothetical protein FQZ97_811050 [compost metagenome]
MSDEKTQLRPGQRRPAAHPGGRAGAAQVEGGLTAESMPRGVCREVALMAAPTQFGRLAGLAEKPGYRPGVDELAGGLGLGAVLRVAFGDMDAAHAQPLRQPRPVLARGRRCGAKAAVAGQFEQRLLEQVGNQAGIGAMGQHRRGLFATPAAQGQHRFAQGVVGALRERQRRVVITAGPGFDAGVQV